MSSPYRLAGRHSSFPIDFKLGRHTSKSCLGRKDSTEYVVAREGIVLYKKQRKRNIGEEIGGVGLRLGVT